jgi:hypothetical protein
LEAAGGAAGADFDGDGVDDAGGEESLRACAQVVDGVGGLAGSDSLLVTEDEERVGELGALLWGVDLLGNDRQFVPAVVGLVVGDRVSEPLELGGDEFRELDVEGEVDRGEVEEVFPEDVQRLVR